MFRFSFCARVSMAAAGLSFGAGVAANGALVAHWSFDTAAITTDAGGDITGALDATGNHNALLGTGIGSASAANGGPTFTSNPIPGTASVAGQFGEGLTLTGNNNFAGGGGQFLMFPELTELMQASGAPSYTVSYWLKTSTTNAHQFTVLSDWGNGTPNPGRFVYGFGFQFASGVAQMRGQARANTGNNNGADIFARAVTTAALNDGEWHMLTWTFNTTTGVLNSYFDGALVETFTSTQAAGFAMTDARSAFGSIGLKGDSGNFINGTIALDEMWVATEELSADAVGLLFRSNLIPEPGTMALVGLGALMLRPVVRRRR